LIVLGYMFHGSCRRGSRVLSLALELISKLVVHYLARKGPRYRRMYICY
jgi:hypothetical protein